MRGAVWCHAPNAIVIYGVREAKKDQPLFAELARVGVSAACRVLGGRTAHLARIRQ